MNQIPNSSPQSPGVVPGGGALLLRSALFAVAALAIIGVASWGVLTAGGDPDTPSPADTYSSAFTQDDGSGQGQRESKQGSVKDGDENSRLRRFTYTDGGDGKKKKTNNKDHDKDQDNDHDGDPDD